MTEERDWLDPVQNSSILNISLTDDIKTEDEMNFNWRGWPSARNEKTKQYLNNKK